MADQRSRADHVDRWLSIAAGVGALCAVGISLYQAALARQQLRASAWPYVQQSNSYVTGQPYTFQVENVGVGPARVRSFEVLVDGRPVPTWSAAIRAFGATPDSGIVYSTFGRGSVLPPGATYTVVRLPSGTLASTFWLAAQKRLATVICYCSIYDECWRADDREDEPTPVRACTSDPATEFRR